MNDKEISKLLEGVKPELLTEKVKKNLVTLIEATVAAEVAKEKKALNEKFEEFKSLEAARIEKRAVKHLDETLVTRLDGWLDLVANEYVNENKLAIENGLGKKLHESLIANMKTVLEQHSIPVAEVSKLEESAKKIDALKAENEKLLEKNLSYKQAAIGAKSVAIFEAVASDLSLTQKSKLKDLAAHLDIDDLKEFKEKLTTIKEHLVTGKVSTPSARPVTKQPIRESVAQVEDSDENAEADTKSPFKFRPEGSPNGAFSNIPDMEDLL